MRIALSLTMALILAASPALAQQTGAGGGGSATPGTGTGLLVGQTSPTLITPVLGVATATSVNNSGAQTNSATGSASSPAQSYTGAPYTGGSATTNFPLVYINTPGATPVTTFGAGTALGINIASASVANILDLYTDNVEQLLLSKTGNLTLAGGLTSTTLSLASTGRIFFGIRSTFGSPADKSFSFTDSSTGFAFTLTAPSSTANVVQLGLVDAAFPAASTIQGQSVVAGTTNAVGVATTIQGSRGTGTGIGGDIIFKVAPAGTTGTAQNAVVTALTISNKGVPALPGFTVSTLPTAPPTGSMAYVTDAVACTFLATLTGGSSTFCPVLYNGAAWVGG